MRPHARRWADYVLGQLVKVPDLQVFLRHRDELKLVADQVPGQCHPGAQVGILRGKAVLLPRTGTETAQLLSQLTERNAAPIRQVLQAAHLRLP